jgi:hypothetical protein
MTVFRIYPAISLAKASKLRSACLHIFGLAIAMALTPATTEVASAQSKLVCPLVGEGTHNGTNATSGHQPNLKLFGTDLGFSYRHGRDIFMLFGDTWNEADFICKPAPVSDDSLGWISLKQDSDPEDCLDIRFPTKGKSSLRPLRVFKNGGELDMGAFRTPITGWSDTRRPYGYFSGENSMLCKPNVNPVCPDGLQCQGGIFCIDPGSSASGIPGGNRAGQRHIAFSHSAPQQPDFTVGYTFATNKFLNATSRTIGRLDERNTKNNIYEPTGSPRELLMWGRPNFFAFPGSTSDVYLLHHSLAGLPGPGDSINWQPRYFAGLDSNDNPVWTNDQIFATPVIANEQLAQVLQFSVAWVKPIKRFVMLYSGRLPRVLPVATSGVYMRSAKHPWGPWSDPKLIWNPLDQGAYDCPGILYTPVAVGADCPVSDPYRPNFAPADNLNQCPAQTPTPHVDFGVEYGVNILAEFSKPGLQINTATIYWNLSTWNPYRVVLMKTKLDGSVVVSP